MFPTAPKVLCPVDFSEPSRCALRYAVAVADHFKAKLYVLKAAPRGDTSSHSMLDACVAVASSGAALHPRPWTGIRIGAASDVILDVARKENVDMIVMSMQGEAGSGQPCGSTTRRVLRHSRAPILLVPSAMTRRHSPTAERFLGDARIVLAPVDFEPRALLDAAVAAAIAAASGLPLVLLHALSPADSGRIEDAQRILEQLSRTLRPRANVRVELIVGEIGAGIARFARDEQAGLIVMGLRGSSARMGEPPGSIAFDVLGRAPALMLAIPEPIGYERTLASNLDAARLTLTGA